MKKITSKKSVKKSQFTLEKKIETNLHSVSKFKNSPPRVTNRKIIHIKWKQLHKKYINEKIYNFRKKCKNKTKQN